MDVPFVIIPTLFQKNIKNTFPMIKGRQHKKVMRHFGIYAFLKVYAHITSYGLLNRFMRI